jgi:hypothetical protein
MHAAQLKTNERNKNLSVLPIYGPFGIGRHLSTYNEKTILIRYSKKKNFTKILS